MHGQGDGAAAGLLKARIKATVRTAQQWDDVRTSANGAERLPRAREAEERPRSIAERLPRPDARGVAELAEVHRAVTARDPRAYMSAIDSLTEMWLFTPVTPDQLRSRLQDQGTRLPRRPSVESQRQTHRPRCRRRDGLPCRGVRRQPVSLHA